MNDLSRRAALGLLLAGFAACGRPKSRRSAGGPEEINRLIAHYARAHDVPEDLVHRVVQRESSYNPGARNGPYYGLMQIHPRTAQTMGFSGPPERLLDPDVNLQYAVKYLRGAYMVAGGDKAAAMGWYARGYYYEAKRLGMLEETGLV